MALASLACFLLVATQPALAAVLGEGRGFVGRQREGALLQTWGAALDTVDAKATPVSRVVKLLEEMKVTLTKEMDEDASLYDKLACWCNTNEYEKTAAVKEAETRISDLTSTIEANTAKVAELKVAIQQLEADVAANKKALGEATSLREKEAKAFHKNEVSSISAIENLKAALVVLGKHHGAAFPQLEPSSGAFLQGGKHRAFDIPWNNKHESRIELSFDNFLTNNGFGGKEDKEAASPHKFLQQSQEAEETQATPAPAHSGDWSAEEKSVLQRALHSATTFMQATHSEDYYPSYSAKSGEILGILNELKDQMTADLSESQKAEAQRAATFEELRKAKSSEIAAGEKQAEAKEDLLAKTGMDLAEAKEDLQKTEATLSEDQKFMVTLKETCTGADKNFETRKAARLQEIKAVSETISILTSDESKDLFSANSFIQVSQQRRGGDLRRKAAALLRGVAAKGKAPELSILATSVELDTFTRVKKAIDDMIAQLKQQSSDEVKKHDWCNSELHTNEVSTMKTEDKKADLTAKVEDLASTISRQTEEIAQAKASIAQLQTNLQRASENRKQENMDFQSTVADQRATMSVLHTALERLAKYYDEEALVQSKATAGQTPPVPQMEYKKSAGAGGVMSMIEKLILDAKEVETDSRKSEIQAQGQYEALVADTNGSVKALQREVMAKTQAKAQSSKERAETQSDLVDTNKELEELGTMEGELHGDCDYLIKNFAVRQEARGQEVEALQQAKQILSGAMQN